MRQHIDGEVLTSDGRSITKNHPFAVEAPDTATSGADLVIGNRARVRLDDDGILSLVYALLLTYRENMKRRTGQ